MNNEIFIPVLRYFTNGNTFSGSSGNLRFFISPSEDKITVKIWHGQFCMEKSVIEEEQTFECSNEGLAQLAEYLKTK